MKIALMPNMTRSNTAEVTKALCHELGRLGLDYCGGDELHSIIPDEAAKHIADKQQLFDNADIIIAIGGDGSVIRAVKQAVITNNRVLGVNAGNLAYMCELDPDELGLLEKLKTGDYHIQKRMMLEAVITENGREVFRERGINDIVFRSDASVNLISLDISANGHKIANYTADGVIFATPTGSSAYSLSAGGAIIEPTVDATLVTPICPHSLRIRPYVFSADTQFTVMPEKGKNHTLVSVDGNEAIHLSENSVVTIRKADISAEFISLKSNLFIDVLNKKLG